MRRPPHVLAARHTAIHLTTVGAVWAARAAGEDP